MTCIDKRAKKILFSTYWKNGWIDSKLRSTPLDDFAYAKSKGLMFDPLDISHDQLIERIVLLKDGMPQEKPAAAFLSSLSTERVDWRSGIASWHFAQAVESHVYKAQAKIFGHSYENGTETPHIRHRCSICGSDNMYNGVDLNVLNFERIRWGGIRHGQLIYTLLDLQQLYLSQIPEPTNADLDIFRGILSVVESSQPSDHPGLLRDRLAPVVRSTKDQRSTLLEILAAVGVLKANAENRPACGGRSDWTFIADWRGEDGYNSRALYKYFGNWGFGAPCLVANL